ncbi:MAG: hypothetical protein ACHQ53_15425 [Polyangiales bacterium]
MSARALWLSLALCACDGAGGRQFCKLGAEHEVTRTHAKQIDGVELVALGAGVIALWSEPSGLFGRRLDGEGRARYPAVRLGVRCEGGLAATTEGNGLAVACLLHPTHGKQDEPGGVALLRLTSELALASSTAIGVAGGLSEGVALARGERGLEVVWHDGSPEAQRVWWASLGEPEQSPQVVSEPGRLASAPSISAHARGTVMAWAENWLQGEELHSRIVFWDRRAPPRTLVPLVHFAATPQLFALGDHVVLGFRDRHAGQKTGLYLARVPASGERAQAPARVGRADGVGRPALLPCMNGVVAATPRTYGGDYFVGINWLDRELERARGEQQFYEDAHAFTQVAAACAGSQAVLLIAEFPQLHRDSAALRAVSYRCQK